MKHWLDSKVTKFLVGQWLVSTLLQLVPMLQAHHVDWWDLGASSVASLAMVIGNWFRDDIEAPIPALNRALPKPGGTD